jgi:hypothetical protein
MSRNNWLIVVALCDMLPACRCSAAFISTPATVIANASSVGRDAVT